MVIYEAGKQFCLCKIQREQREISVYTLKYAFLKQWSKYHTLNLRQTDKLNYIFLTQLCSNLPSPARVRQCCHSIFNKAKVFFPRLIPKFQTSKHIRLTNGVKQSAQITSHTAEVVLEQTNAPRLRCVE